MVQDLERVKAGARAAAIDESDKLGEHLEEGKKEEEAEHTLGSGGGGKAACKWRFRRK